MKRRNSRFLGELGVILAACAIVAAMFTESVADTLEARIDEAKASGHKIQIAIERYGVDHDFYPNFLYGGDVQSTFTTLVSSLCPRALAGDRKRDFSDYNGDPRAIDGDNDTLLQWGYLSTYPQNPFVHQGEGITHVITDPHDSTRTRATVARISMSAVPRAGCSGLGEIAGWQFALPRVPDGRDGLRMWDVSEGQRHPPFTVLHPGERAGAYYQPPKGFEGAMITADEHNPSGAEGSFVNENSIQMLHPHLPGNFYYYPVLSSPGNWNIYYAMAPNSVVGYRVMVYGPHDREGQDMYDMFGDCEERMISQYADQLNVPGENTPNLGGPDGRPDGVMMEMSSMPQVPGTGTYASTTPN